MDAPASGQARAALAPIGNESGAASPRALVRTVVSHCKSFIFPASACSQRGGLAQAQRSGKAPRANMVQLEASACSMQTTPSKARTAPACNE